MPTYTYHCLDCGHEFDALRKMADRLNAPKCPACDSELTELGLSAPFVRGGSGGGTSRSSGSSCGSGFG